MCWRSTLAQSVFPTLNIPAMGVSRNFSRGGNVDISLILFQVADDAMQMDFHKKLYPFYITKKIPRETTRFVRIILKSYSRGVVFDFTKRYFLSSFTLISFAELGYHPISLLLWTADNWVWTGLELSQLRLTCSHWSVRVEAHFSKFSLKCFLYFGYQKSFSFH